MKTNEEKTNPLSIGNKATVTKDARTNDPSFAEFFTKYVGQTGTIVYLDQDLVSLKFNDDVVIAYWHSEVKDVADQPLKSNEKQE